MNARVACATIAAIVWASAACGGTETELAGDPPTYHRDVKAIVDVSCTGCHVAGGVAPFSLTTHAEVSAHAAAIKGAVTRGTMPPWPPSKDCTDYQRDRSLTKEQIATIAAWVDGGAKEGDPKDAPAKAAPAGEGLARVDRTIPLPEAYTPAKAPDDYRCFMLDWPETSTRYITGLGVEPDAGSIVHHAIVFHATPAQVATYQALDDADPGPGWTCFGGPGGNTENQRAGWVGGWVPGGRGAESPPGAGIEIVPGSKLIVQMHYNTSAAPAVPDRTSILLTLEDSVKTKASIIPFANPQWVKEHTMTIPAHGKDVVHTFSTDLTPFMSLLTSGAVPSNGSFKIWNAGLHMHTQGRSATVAIERQGGGDECMLDIDAWNFHWQGSYDFTAPKTVNPGDRLSIECHFDNPSANDMNWGEGTLDEMCLGIFYVTE